MTKLVPDLARLLEGFFIGRLMRDQEASPHTIVSYRDTFRLLLRFAQQRLKKPPSKMSLQDLDAPLIGQFLDDIEKTRGNSARTRNTRLAAIHSFFEYAALEEPTRSETIQRVLAIPPKRFIRRTIDFLSRKEVDALLAAPDASTRAGLRDHAVLLLAVETGLRSSELIGLQIGDVVLGAGAHVRCRGKGRKERCTPLRKATVAVMKRWLRERGGAATDPLFINARNRPLSPDGFGYIITKHVATAKMKCPTLARKRVSPHVLRHTAAMELLRSGVDRSVIALWLGHEDVSTTQMYLDADLELKEKALARTAPRKSDRRRYRPGDRLLEFLKAL